VSLLQLAKCSLDVRSLEVELLDDLVDGRPGFFLPKLLV
jgi:hypothetical protein